jgi:tetratricopeptide (TPR) repeat protein
MDFYMLEKKISHQNNSSSTQGKKRRSKIILSALLFIVVSISAIVIFLVLQPFKSISVGLSPSTKMSLAWDKKSYEEVIHNAEDILHKSPFSVNPLRLIGFSHFYLGQAEVNYNQQIYHYNQSIKSLRRILSISTDSKVIAQVYYILAKNYYHLGYYYYDLAYKHFKSAEEMNYHQPDSFEYLGLTSAELGRAEEGIQYLIASHDENNRAIILLTIARLYDSLENYGKTAEFAQLAIAQSADNYIKEQGFLLAGEGFRKSEDLDTAKKMYNSLQELNPNSADARYYLGEIAAAEGDNVLARALWREAYELNPKHAGAINRLNS